MSRTTMSPTKPPTARGRKARAFGAVVAALVIGFTALGAATPAAAAAPVGTGTNQEIRNQQNTLCMDDYAFNTQPGAEVRQWTCLEGQNQLWAIVDLGNGYAEIKNKYSNLCLDNYNFATAPGSEVRQWTCNGANVQQWQLTDVGGGWTEIRNKHNNLCVASAASPVDGALLSQQTCNGSGVQRWRLTDPNVSKITYTLYTSATPSADEADAYARITDAMDRAVARYNKFNNTWRHLNVYYAPGVPTAEASINGDIRFGSNRGFMQEGTALHEMSHTVGVGTAGHFQGKCDAQDWPAALPLLRSWDGSSARINCGGSHMWPYGLNYSDEYNEVNFDRNVRLVQAMHHDGL
ncbi:RICIN domain-containing protein [Microbacterium sp. 22296]|uniref:RICIN domain-containing protein n=1 Tax=Microbacterium sp. 22296 TaxID=3453903 RepID=UPI003F87F4C8